MSTKIYDGCKINVNTFEELHTFFDKVTTDMRKMQYEAALKLYANQLELFVDTMSLGEYTPEYSDYTGGHIGWYIYDRIRKKYKKNEEARLYEIEPDFDLSLKISVFVLPNKILALAYGNSEFAQKFQKYAEVEEYGYWDNTDQPDDVTDEEWKQRESDWDIALPGIGVVKDNSMTYEVLSFNTIPFEISCYTNIKKYLNTKAVRAQRYANRNLHNKVTDDIAKAMDYSYAKDGISGLLEADRKASQEIQDGKHKKEYTKYYNKIYKRLPSITEEYFRTKQFDIENDTLKFIGSGSAFNTERGCNAAYINIDNTLILFDCGGDTFGRLREQKVISSTTKNVHVFISHLHPDHVGSLGDLIHYSYFNLDLHKKIKIYCRDRNIVNMLDALGVKREYYDYIATRSGHANFINTESSSIYCKTVTVKHQKKMKCSGFLIHLFNTDQELNSETIYYSGDCNAIPGNIVSMLKNGKLHKIYQDTCLLDYKNNIHMSIDKLIRTIPVKYRQNVCCMHIDNELDENIYLIKQAGFSWVHK